MKIEKKVKKNKTGSRYKIHISLRLHTFFLLKSFLFVFENLFLLFLVGFSWLVLKTAKNVFFIILRGTSHTELQVLPPLLRHLRPYLRPYQFLLRHLLGIR